MTCSRSPSNEEAVSGLDPGHLIKASALNLHRPFRTNKTPRQDYGTACSSLEQSPAWSRGSESKPSVEEHVVAMGTFLHTHPRVHHSCAPSVASYNLNTAETGSKNTEVPGFRRNYLDIRQKT